MALDNIVEKDNVHEAKKRLDFVIKSQNTLFLIEVNFFSDSGSKLNGVTFVWITDGRLNKH